MVIIKGDLAQADRARALLKAREKTKFAFLPVKLNNNSWIWLERYRRAPIKLWISHHKNSNEESIPGTGILLQYGGEYFPHRNFKINDKSYFSVANFMGGEEDLVKYLKELVLNVSIK